MSTLEDEVKVNGVYGGVQTDNVSTTESTTTTGTTSTAGTTNTTDTTSTSSAASVTSNISNTSTVSATTNLPVTRSFWSNMKAFWLQEIDLKKKIDWKREIKVELTPYQQKIEDEINEFLHQDITWEKFRNFITKPFTKKA